jgi:cytidylate kinase
LTSPKLQLEEMLIELGDSDLDFVVIGSSALAIQGWGVEPGDLDLMCEADQVEGVREVLGIDPDRASWSRDGDARRLECSSVRGSVDIYVEVSGGLSFSEVVRDAQPVAVGAGRAVVRTGSLEHVRNMRAAVGREPVPAGAIAPNAEANRKLQVIAIDGPAGAGKSTVTRAVADRLGFTYLDTGAMYRSVTLAVLERHADTDDHAAIGRIAEDVAIEFDGDRVLLDGVDVSRTIRGPEISLATPHIAAYPEVRRAMARQQRQLFAQGRFVAEGRDTTTVIAPDAALKIYLTASPEERAARRARESGEEVEAVLRAMEERDRLDSERELSALRVADDAVVIDTTGRSVKDVVAEIAALARTRQIA